MDKLFLWGAKVIKKYTNFMIPSYEKFEETLAKHKKVLIIFWHPLCVPCKKIMCLTPFLYIFYKIKWIQMKFCDIRENKKIAETLKITTTPSMIIYADWKILKRFEDEQVMKNILKV